MFITKISCLPSDTEVVPEFRSWVTQHCDHTSTVLDVGAGIGRNGQVVGQKAAQIVGIDPNPLVEQNPYLDEWYQGSIEEFAKNRGSYFDCLYTMFVLEHVNHPYEFLSACRSLLKQDGMLFAVTPNLWHYFGMATKLSKSLKIEDWLLKQLKGAQKMGAYHFPTQYRLNSIPTISRMLGRVGFREVEFRCFDQIEGFRNYFPKPLRWFPGLYQRSVYALRLPQFMGYIMFKATA